MKHIIETLFIQSKLMHKTYPEEIHQVNTNKGMLTKDFNDWQKMRLFEIEDGLEGIAARWSEDSFAEGVRCGVRLMMEVMAEEDDE